jgi:hypothetical protein
MRLVVIIVAALTILGVAASGLILARKGEHSYRNGGFDGVHRFGDAGGISSPHPCASQSNRPSDGFRSVAPHFPRAIQ